MERRSLLNSIAGGALLLTAGCVGPGEQETTTKESDGSSSANSSGSHTVSISKRVESQSRLERVLKVSEGGMLDYELTCPDGTQKTASGSVTADEWAALEDLVVSFDRDGLREKYECASGCPQDIPPKQIELTVDGSTVTTVIEASASIPSELEEMVSKVEAFEESLQKPTCG